MTPCAHTHAPVLVGRGRHGGCGRTRRWGGHPGGALRRSMLPHRAVGGDGECLVTAGALGPVHRLVGPEEQGRRLLPGSCDDGHTDAAGEADRGRRSSAGSRIASMSRWVITSASAVSSTAATTVNSSPPQRATRSPGRTASAGGRRRRSAVRRPTAWPNRSFTCLNSSRSMKKTATWWLVYSGPVEHAARARS